MQTRTPSVGDEWVTILCAENNMEMQAGMGGWHRSENGAEVQENIQVCRMPVHSAVPPGRIFQSRLYQPLRSWLLSVVPPAPGASWPNFFLCCLGFFLLNPFFIPLVGDHQYSAAPSA